jgi:hypothetical protein
MQSLYRPEGVGMLRMSEDRVPTGAGRYRHRGLTLVVPDGLPLGAIGERADFMSVHKEDLLTHEQKRGGA